MEYVVIERDSGFYLTSITREKYTWMRSVERAKRFSFIQAKKVADESPIAADVRGIN